MQLPNIDEKFIKQYKELLICGLLLFLAVAFGLRQVIVSVMKVQSTTQEHKKQKAFHHGSILLFAAFLLFGKGQLHN